MGISMNEEVNKSQLAIWEKPVFESLIQDTDKSTATEILQIFLSSIRDIVNLSTERREQPAVVAEICHRLRSSSHWLGFSNFHNLCTLLDDQFKNNKKIDPDTLEQWTREAADILNLTKSKEFSSFLH